MKKAASKTTTAAPKKTGTKHVSTNPPKTAAASAAPPAKAPVVAEAPTGKKEKRVAPALALKVVEGATNPARESSKRYAWIQAIMGAKTVAQAIATPMPQGVEPVNMSHVAWCIKAKLVRTEPLGK